MASLADRIGTSDTRAMKRTRLGKIVGSVKPPLEAWTYWKQGDKWYVVAPSGARFECYDNELDAMRRATERNREDASA